MRSKDKTHVGRFTSISDILLDGIMTFNFFGYITYVNPAFVELTGFSKQELVGKHLVNLPTLKGRDIKPFLKTAKDFILGNIDSAPLHFAYTKKDGSYGIGDGLFSTIFVDGKKEVVGIIKDVTDTKTIEKEYLNIFRSSPIGIMHTNLKGEIKDVNDSCIKLFGIHVSKYVGKKVYDLKELNGIKEELIKMYDDLSFRNEAVRINLKLETSTKLRIIEVYVSVIEIYGELFGTQISFRDITKQTELENQRQLYMKKLEEEVRDRTNQIIDNEKMVALGKVATMIAHDLKGPLQIIKNSTYLIAKEGTDKKKYHDYINKAITQADSLIDAMNFQKNANKLNVEETDISEIINEAIIQIQVSNNFTYTIENSSRSTLMLDKFKIIRVFNNLIKNSLEAMSDGGEIRILVEEDNDAVSIKIIDSGKGIPEEKRAMLFRPFQSTKQKGMGLGLYYCKNTIEAHGGSIEVDSINDSETVFTIILPIKRMMNDVDQLDNSDTIHDIIDEIISEANVE